MISLCPSDDQLLALATDEPGSNETQQPVDQCDTCQRRVKQLRGEVAELRSFSAVVTATSSFRSMSGALSDPADAVLPNSTEIGRYIVIDNLGSGGQADVYRVIDPNLGRQLVLKLSHRQSTDDSQRRDCLAAVPRRVLVLR